MAGIYVHVPFCSSFCIYCDFYSEIGSRRMAEYKDALLQELSYRKSFFKGVLPETLYFGGGTPSLLPVDMLEEIVFSIRETFEIEEFKEFTIEVNPDDIVAKKFCRKDADKLTRYNRLGVNRVSMGVQSFNDVHLHWMNRRHNSAQAVAAYAALRDAGFDNISLDLIFGYDALDDTVWNEDISQILELSPEHISCYQMSVEPGSKLGEMASKGNYREPDQEVCAGEYKTLQKRLSDAGYLQYEISNFAKPGFESRHNSSYWLRKPYLGLGPAAHSFDGDRIRSWAPSDIKLWENNLRNGGESEILSDDDIFNEQIMLGLRRCSGLDISTLEHSRLDIIKPALNKLVKAGRICLDDNRLYIPKENLFVSDSIMSELFL